MPDIATAPNGGGGRLRVLVAHGAYQQRGGEDSVVADEVEMLRARGHQVELFTRHNDEVDGLPRIQLAMQTLWSTPSAKSLSQRIEHFQPDVLHVHNTFPLLSPSVYWAAQRRRVPVVQTLHNFRLLCPQAMFLREGKVCEDCLGKLPLAGVRHGCFRGSRGMTGVMVGMLALHRGLGTWQQKVDRYIALNDFCRRKFIEGGLPADRIVVKPNFVDLPAPGASKREGILFVGRLSPEKGVATLLEAAGSLPDRLIRVAGDGPMAPDLARHTNVIRLGALDANSVRAQMQTASALVLPSIWYENFPRTLVEAFANGLPVVASRIGALAELVEDQVTGLLFEPGDARDLERALRWALAHPARMAEMGAAARARYERDYSAAGNHAQLVAIYREAMAQCAGALTPA